LLQAEFSELRRLLLVYPLAILPLVAMLAWFGAVQHGMAAIHAVIFNGLLALGGTLVASSAFWQFRETSSKRIWLALPARTIEKLASKFLLVVPIYLVALYAGYALIAAAVDGLFALSGFHAIDRFEPFAPGQLALVQVYLAAHGVLVLGAAVFDRHPLARTLAVLAALAGGVFVIGYVVLRIAYPDHFDGWQLVEKIRFDTGANPATGRLLPEAMHAAFFFLLPVSMWVAAFFVLKRKEL
jgi:hypothetical protein